jgi:hypothetical protein
MTLDVPRIASSWAQNTRTHRLLRSSPASSWALYTRTRRLPSKHRTDPSYLFHFMWESLLGSTNQVFTTCSPHSLFTQLSQIPSSKDQQRAIISSWVINPLLGHFPRESPQSPLSRHFSEKVIKYSPKRSQPLSRASYETDKNPSTEEKHESVSHKRSLYGV